MYSRRLRTKPEPCGPEPSPNRVNREPYESPDPSEPPEPEPCEPPNRRTKGRNGWNCPAAGTCEPHIEPLEPASRINRGNWQTAQTEILHTGMDQVIDRQIFLFFLYLKAGLRQKYADRNFGGGGFLGQVLDRRVRSRFLPSKSAFGCSCFAHTSPGVGGPETR